MIQIMTLLRTTRMMNELQTSKNEWSKIQHFKLSWSECCRCLIEKVFWILNYFIIVQSLSNIYNHTTIINILKFIKSESEIFHIYFTFQKSFLCSTKTQNKKARRRLFLCFQQSWIVVDERDLWHQESLLARDENFLFFINFRMSLWALYVELSY